MTHKEENKEYKYKFSNSVKSGDAINIDGSSIIGKAKSAGIKLETLKKFGLSDTQAKALKFVSTHEGNFDAINTYDKAIMSYGFVQFAGGGRSFNKLLALMKKDHPDKFKEKFESYGIDVEYLENDKGIITKATTVATDISTGKKLRGAAAEDYISINVELIGAFIVAGHDSDLQESQIKLAAKNYVKPAAKLKFRASANVKISETKTLTLENKLISDVLSSTKGTTALINMAINDGLGGARSKISKGVRDYISENKSTISTIKELQNADEKEILKKIKKHAFKPKRIDAIINATDL